MNAIAQVMQTRAAGPAPENDPHLMHGVLLLLEENISAHAISLAMGGVGSTAVRGMAERARRGHCVRAAAWNGERHVHLKGATVAPLGERLYFNVAWYRDAITLMLEPDGASTSQIEDIATRHLLDAPIPKMISRLRGALNHEGFSVAVEPYEPGSRAFRYRIVGVYADRMRRIIANGWAAE